MDTLLVKILAYSILMSSIALIGGVFVFFSDRILNIILKFLVAFAAGSLIGGSLFHMIPEALQLASTKKVMLYIFLGYASFFLLDQLLEWHHCHQLASKQEIKPLGMMILIADGLHNFIGGLAITGIFLVDYNAGVAAWIAAALHELPQEIGDFASIVHSGYSKARALLYNFASALGFPLGSILAYALRSELNLSLLIGLGAGNFLYIAGADLIPEIKTHPQLKENILRFICFCTGGYLLMIIAT